MAATVAAYQYQNWPGGPAHPLFAKFTVTCDTSYPTGGYPITKVQAGFPGGVLFDIHVGVANLAGTHYLADWDDVAQKIKVINSATGAEIAGATNLTGLVLTCVAFGLGQ